MFRRMTCMVFAAALAAPVLNARLSAQPAAEKPVTTPKPMTAAAKAVALAARLARPIDFDRPAENDTLGAVIQRLAKQHRLTVWINKEAFKAEGADAVEETPVDLPPAAWVFHSTALLHRLLRPVNGDYHPPRRHRSK